MRLFRLAALTTTALCLAAAGPAPRNLAVDNAASEVSARVAFMGLGTRTARFPQVSGSVRFDDSAARNVSLQLDIDARSIEAPDAVTLQRLRGAKFFAVDSYPQISFRSQSVAITGANRGTVRGTLTARGIARPVSMEVQFDRPLDTVLAGQAVTISGQTQIDRRQFGMTAYRPIVGNQVTIAVTARLVPQG